MVNVKFKITDDSKYRLKPHFLFINKPYPAIPIVIWDKYVKKKKIEKLIRLSPEIKFQKTTKNKSNTLVKKLDLVFSKYIRLRDTKDGYGRCISCNKIKTYANLDCGHFISRNKHAVRWNEKNANVQCQQCNRFLSGKQFEHALAIDKKYGAGTAESLLNYSKLRVAIDHEKLMLEYKEKINKLLGERWN